MIKSSYSQVLASACDGLVSFSLNVFKSLYQVFKTWYCVMFMNSQLSEYFSTENHPFVEVSSFDACSQESKLCF